MIIRGVIWTPSTYAALITQYGAPKLRPLSTWKPADWLVLTKMSFVICRCKSDGVAAKRPRLITPMAATAVDSLEARSVSPTLHDAFCRRGMP